MCFYVRIVVLPPSSFLHLVTVVLNKLSFGPESILFLKMRASIYSLDGGIVKLCDIDSVVCLFWNPKPGVEVGGIGSKLLLDTYCVPGTELVVRELKMN